MSTTTATPVRYPTDTRVRDIVPIYFRHGSPRLLFSTLVALVAARIWVAEWSWWDLVAAVAIVALQPFTEWLIHTFVLHFRPKTIAGRTFDFHLAKEHRRHHRDPKLLEAVFIPLRVLVVAIPVQLVILLLIFPTHIALTIAVTFTLVGNVYEWTHFYIHSNCKPKNRYAKYIERAHRLHHYRNEQCWMGVTNHAADHVLGTFPDKDAVPVSPTAKTLGIDLRR